jgi:16S rRNA G966 N2-methylase RsmD
VKREDAEEFTQALGQIVGGSWRQIALAKRIGVPKALGVSLEDWVEKRLGGYVRMSMADRREAVKELAGEGMSNVAIGEVLGVDEGTVRNARRSENSEVDGDGASNDAVDRTSTSENSEKERRRREKAAEKETRRSEKAGRKSAVPDDLPLITDRYRLVHGDIEDAEIEPGSVDCIVTDPPYPKEFIDCYATLARKAAEWLKPGGSLLAMSGQTYLPDVVAALKTGGLSYQWTLSYLTPGGQAAQIFPRRVNTFWKPVFWLVKGAYAGDWIGDVARSNPNDNDKRFHNWGQSESGMADLVSRFTDPGHVICDPFMGGATTGVVAIAMDRLFIGVEKDAEAFETARQRLGNGNAAAMVA